MHRAVSIHIGVNRPGGLECKHPVLRHSENAAWRMAVLASQAGYESLQVLRGRAATRLAVHDALAFAAGLLEKDDNLLITFSGHGEHQSATGDREREDETWCLFDGEMVDNKLLGYLRLFEEDVRIVVLSESCYGGGMSRTGDTPGTGTPKPDGAVRMRDGGMGAATRMRDGETGVAGAPATPGGGADPCDEVLAGVDWGSGGDAPGNPGSSAAGPGSSAAGQVQPVSCVTQDTLDPLAIRAQVLMLTAAAEGQRAIDGVFTCALLRLWNGGAFRGSYCDLYGTLRQRVRAATNGKQDPQILIGGSACPHFPLMDAFHLELDPGTYFKKRYRGERATCELCAQERGALRAGGETLGQGLRRRGG